MTSDRIPWQQDTIIHHSQRLLHSYHHWTGHHLFDRNCERAELAELLFTAPFVLVSHGTEPDPIFNYGNRKALQLWEISWEEFTQMPSRKSAPEIVKQERASLLSEAATEGFSSNYSGIRISSTGKQFYIEDTSLWNVLDEQNQRRGQAAMFSKWTYI
ncbi:MAG: MEKHLA domain-containing protein [Nostocaceae cyanobacterium]|nr:MEKHLA domain-containing protein [Nostocaceae cyanobacterium]